MIELSAALLRAESCQDRVAVLTDNLAAFGVTAINAAEVAPTSHIPHWFHSTLSPDVRDLYLADGHWRHDFITKAAQGSAPAFFWDDRRSVDTGAAAADLSFDRFLRETGASATISVFMPSGPLGDRRALTAVLVRPDRAAIDPRETEEMVAILRLAIPWIDDLDDPAGAASTRLTFPRTTLSKRERQAMRFLAGGLRVARIADAMGVSEAMVAKHITSARRKLAARTREQAIAEAIRTRQIDRL